MRQLLAPYFSLKGRSSRREWWMIDLLVIVGFHLNHQLFGLLSRGDGGAVFQKPGQAWFLIAIALGCLSVASIVRRLHDRGKSGWWSLPYLIPGIGQVWCIVECGFLDGQPHANRYGPPTGAVGTYRSLANQLTARLQALGAAVPAPTRAPKVAATAARAEPAATARETRRVSVLAASQRPTVQRGSSLPLPSGRALRMAIAVVALLLGLATMALTGGIPIPTGVVPVGTNPDMSVFRLVGQPAQP
jgi:uncharacterized membrane protein YhaH (DUF805 family)